MAPREFFSLEDILADDSEGLLETREPARAPPQLERAVSGFEDINAFIDAHGHAPRSQADGGERLLARRLSSIRRDPQKVAALTPYDRHGLLQPGPPSGGIAADAPAEEPPRVDAAEEVTSLSDIFSDDDGLLDEGCSELFEARHVSFSGGRNLPDEIAQRTPCEDFWRFESLFVEIREELKAGTAKTRRFKQASQVSEGDFFILDGVLALVDRIGETDEGSGEKHNPRIRVIFDNATQSNMLLLSFTRGLYKDRNGRRVLPDPDRALDKMAGITHHDRRQGTIYILRSLSQRRVLAGIRELYKIGYTEESIERRIAGAPTSPTYLEAPVEVVATYECYNANPHAIERLIHAMLAPQKLNVTLRAEDGSRYRPREWFCVPLETAKAVVERIADGTISQYRIDGTSARLVPKSRRYSGDETGGG